MPAPMAEAVWTQATQQLVLGVKLVKGAEAQVLLGGDEPVKLRLDRKTSDASHSLAAGRIGSTCKARRGETDGWAST